MRINHRVSPPETEMELANKEAAVECFSKAQADFREGKYMLLGWLIIHYKCAELRRQMVRMLNCELTYNLANALSRQCCGK